MNTVIECLNLSKQYKNLLAVDRVSLKIQAGEIYGFLGLNGAGKTTTIRMLLGMIKASGGSCHLFGSQIGTRCTLDWNRVGYLVETPSAYPELTVWENLEQVRKLRQLEDQLASPKIIESLGLDRYRNVKAGHLSLGNMQRLGLAKAMIHNPDLLILDEPANGLDPAGIVDIRTLLRDLAHKEGKTIFVSSHILGEVARFAHRIGIIHQGKLIRELDIDTLREIHQSRLLIDTTNNRRASELLYQKGYSVTLNSDGLLESRDEKALAETDLISTLLVQGQCPPLRIQPVKEDLESFFMRTVQEAGVDHE